MYAEFIVPGVATQINVTDTVRQRVTAKLNAMDATADEHLFDECEHIAVELMRGNHFVEFASTAQYKALRIDDAPPPPPPTKAQNRSRFCAVM